MPQGDPQRRVAERNREKLRHKLHVDQLQLGQRIPKNIEAACVLGLTDKRAGMHLHVLLAELHISWKNAFIDGVRARVVVEAPIPGLLL